MFKYILFILPIILSCSHNKSAHKSHANEVMNKKVFENLVEAFESPKRGAYQKPDLIIAALGNIKSKHIIDIGAGTGYFSIRMARKGAFVTHADIDDRFLNYAKKRANKEGLSDYLDTKKVPFDDPLMGVSQYHYALVVNTYHHIEDRSEYFKKVKEGLLNGGSLIIVDFKKIKSKSEPQNFPSEKMRILPDKVKEELATAGFTRFRVDKRMLPYYYIIYAK